ncbi:MAG: hypothetical protein AB1640_04425 [bacterium]
MGKRKKADILVRMRGIVTPSDWDEQNQVTAITLATVDEQEYRIHQDNKGKQLLRMLRREVEVCGVVGTDGAGNRMVRVMTYDVRGLAGG